MYSKWLSLCQLFTVHPNVVWLNMVLIGLNATKKSRGVVCLLRILRTLLKLLLRIFHTLSAAYSIGYSIGSIDSGINLVVLLSFC